MTGRFEHNCQTCEPFIHRVLDGGCSSQMEKAHYIKQIQSCPRCADKYEQEQSFRVFLQNKIPKKTCSQSLLSNIMNGVGIRKEEGNIRSQV